MTAANLDVIHAGSNPRPRGLGDKEFAERFGIKALGLSRLPTGTTPAYIAVSAEVYCAWKQVKDVERSLELCGLPDAALWRAAMENAGPELIVRSSATDESFRDRGRYDSFSLDARSSGELNRVITQVFEQYEAQGASGAMGLVIQRRISPLIEGHLSNEHRVSDKPYRWRVETLGRGDQSPQAFTLSAKQAQDLELDKLLRLDGGRGLRRGLASVAKWAWRSAVPLNVDRSAIEWGWDGRRLWLFQWDAVQDEADTGVDPRQKISPATVAPSLEDGEVFRRHTVAGTTPWPKLKALEAFAIGVAPPKHRLFSTTADRLDELLSSPERTSSLKREICSLTAGRAVLRSDTVRGGMDLPKTDTVGPEAAIEFLRRSIVSLRSEGVDLRDVAFLLHQFIEAVAAAWTYHRCGSDLVHVDALWGLADGMQFLHCDTYVFDLRLGREVSSTIRYKGKILQEQADGTWAYADVRGTLARQRVLSRKTVAELARRTAEIARHKQRDAQIMWFSGVPPELGLGEHLPWYTLDAQQDISERRARALRPYRVRRLSDLEDLPQNPTRLKIVLEPDPCSVRDRKFLEVVAQRGKELGIPIEMRGSVLAHAYHQLRAMGADVYSAQPTKRLAEVRQRKAYDKLVRDEVPETIVANGESVRTWRLTGDDRRRAITAKLVEEAEEFLLASSVQARTEELADLVELVRSLAEETSVSLESVILMADLKRGKRGGFIHGVMLGETSTRITSDPDDPLLPGFASFGDSTHGRTTRETRRPSDLGGPVSLPMNQLIAVNSPQSVELQSRGGSATVRVALRQGRLILELVRARSDLAAPKLL